MNSKKSLVIIGAGGHGRVVADIACRMGYKQILFLDDCAVSGTVGKTEDYTKYLERADFFVAIGNSSVRNQIQAILSGDGANLVSLIHPNAVVAADVVIGLGTVIMAGAVVNAGTIIGNGVIVNTCASVDHDCRIGNFVHVAVGAHICGTVEVGDHAWIGAGATVINNVTICGDCVIGAGAVVVCNVENIGVYTGIPAKKRK